MTAPETSNRSQDSLDQGAPSRHEQPLEDRLAAVSGGLKSMLSMTFSRER
jgi:hypothetical protein